MQAKDNTRRKMEEEIEDMRMDMDYGYSECDEEVEGEDLVEETAWSKVRHGDRRGHLCGQQLHHDVHSNGDNQLRDVHDTHSVWNTEAIPFVPWISAKATVPAVKRDSKMDMGYWHPEFDEEESQGEDQAEERAWHTVRGGDWRGLSGRSLREFCKRERRELMAFTA